MRWGFLCENSRLKWSWQNNLTCSFFCFKFESILWIELMLNGITLFSNFATKFALIFYFDALFYYQKKIPMCLWNFFGLLARQTRCIFNIEGRMCLCVSIWKKGYKIPVSWVNAKLIGVFIVFFLNWCCLSHNQIWVSCGVVCMLYIVIFIIVTKCVAC